VSGKISTAAVWFWSELKRRRVIKTMIAYAVGAWILVEVSATVFPALLLPEWAVRIVVATVILAFPVIVILAWVFDIERKPDVDLTPGDAHIVENGERENRSLPPSLDSAVSSVAVLPFESLPKNESNKYFADGIATELHSRLSQVHRLRVISRTSSFAGVGVETDIKKVADRLGAKFIISGSVRFSEDRIRVVVELDNAVEGVQIWSETYDRQLEDVFSVQGEIAEAVTGAFGGARLRDEITEAMSKTTNLDAWTMVQKARSFVLEFTPKALNDAVPLLRRAIDIDANYAVAHAALAFVLSEQVLNGLSDDLVTDRAMANESANQGFALSPGDPFVLKMCGAAWAYCGKTERSLSSLRQAAIIAPFDFGAWGYMGWSLVQSGSEGELHELHEIMERMLLTEPRHSGAPYWLYHRSVACTCEGLEERAVEFAQRSIDANPAFPWGWMQYANALGTIGVSHEAWKAARRSAEISPGLTPQHYEMMIRRMSSSDEVAMLRLIGLRESQIIPG
jgi:adenylate cyclase